MKRILLLLGLLALAPLYEAWLEIPGYVANTYPMSEGVRGAAIAPDVRLRLVLYGAWVLGAGLIWCVLTAKEP